MDMAAGPNPNPDPDPLPPEPGPIPPPEPPLPDPQPHPAPPFRPPIPQLKGGTGSPKEHMMTPIVAVSPVPVRSLSVVTNVMANPSLLPKHEGYPMGKL